MDQPLNADKQSVQVFNTLGAGEQLNPSGASVTSTEVPVGVKVVRLHAEGGDVNVVFGGSGASATATDPLLIKDGVPEYFKIPTSNRYIAVFGTATVNIVYSSY